ncbi:MAG: FxLYD domain-containing protein [Candidatus Solibacter sp.]|nr:FxLYD domain-containing protein [Candidatus Solibacter sp.]
MDSPFGRTTMKRIREFLESIVFAGLKPGGQTAPKPQLRWLGPLRGPVERLLSGGPAPTDPLYLTNRTLAQKLKSWSLVAIPCAVLAVGIVVTLSNVADPPGAPPPKEPTTAEIAAKLLPNMNNLKLAPPSDVQVLELRVDGSQLVGVVKNTAAREIAVVELVIDLTSASGSQVGAVKGTVEKLPAWGRKDFRIPIKQSNATFALIREVTSN